MVVLDNFARQSCAQHCALQLRLCDVFVFIVNLVVVIVNGQVA